MKHRKPRFNVRPLPRSPGVVAARKPLVVGERARGGGGEQAAVRHVSCVAKDFYPIQYCTVLVPEDVHIQYD